MRFIRPIVAALLALSLAVTPAVAQAAFAAMDAPAQSSHDEMAGMPDCHKAMQQNAQQPAKDTHSNKCPDCDKGGRCTVDACQLKCFNVLGMVAGADRIHDNSGQRFRLAASSPLEPRSFKPQPPPPRS